MSLDSWIVPGHPSFVGTHRYSDLGDFALLLHTDGRVLIGDTSGDERTRGSADLKGSTGGSTVTLPMVNHGSHEAVLFVDTPGVPPVSPDSPAGVERFAELGGRAHAERGMRMDGVVVCDPSGDEIEHRGGVGQGRDADVVALEGLHEGLAHSVAFGRPDRREAGGEAEGRGEVALAIVLGPMADDGSPLAV